MAIIDLPTALHSRRQNENFWLTSTSTTSGRGLDGREVITFTENRYWTGQIDLVHLFGDDILSARSIGTRLRGRANQLRVPFCNRGTLQYLGNLSEFYDAAGVSAAEQALGYLRFGDGAEFDDGSGFALPDYAEPTFVLDAAAGATSAQLDGYVGRNATVGARFSVNDFLYEIETNDDGVVTFSPPLREAVTAGTEAKINEPSILVRLADDRGWEPFTNYGHHNKPMTVDVVEAFDR